MSEDLGMAKPKDRPRTVIQHLEELRWRIIWSLAAVTVGMAFGLAVAERVLQFIIRTTGVPRLAMLGVAEGFLAQFKIALVLGLVLGSPVVLYQILAFVLPALERQERLYLFIFLPISVLLFLGGTAFAFTTVLPSATRFFLKFAGENIYPVISVGAYVSYVLGVLLPFGLVFQLPVATALLTKLGIISPEFMARYRGYAILVIFILAAALTPPDAVSQLLLALPMVGLYELSILCARLVHWRSARRKSTPMEVG